MHSGHQSGPGYTADGVYIETLESDTLRRQAIQIRRLDLRIVPPDISPPLIVRDDDYHIRLLRFPKSQPDPQNSKHE